MTKDTNNTNATIDGDFEAFKVTMGVKQNLPYWISQWLTDNWRTIERLVMDKDCVLSYREYKDVLQGHSCQWGECFDDTSLWQKFIYEQNDKGAWVEDDEQVILELITRYAHKLDERRAFDNNEYYINRTIKEIKQKIDEGFSIAYCRTRKYDIKINWVRTSREKSNALGICDEICALFKSLMRKKEVDWEEGKILDNFRYAISNSSGWKNKVSSWAHAYMMDAVPMLGWEQTLAIASETLSREIVRKFLETKDYGVFGTYEHRVWNSEKRTHEIVVEDMGRIMKERMKWVVDDIIKWEMAPHEGFIAKAKEFIAKVA